MKPVKFQEKAFEQFCDWASEDKKIFKKITDLIKDIDRNAFKGKGKPEPLKHRYKGHWSRRITQKHRLIYKITSQNEIVIVNCKGHYD